MHRHAVTQETYLENLAFLGDGWYNVEDKGFHPEFAQTTIVGFTAWVFLI